jgi:hypothetical protein
MQVVNQNQGLVGLLGVMVAIALALITFRWPYRLWGVLVLGAAIVGMVALIYQSSQPAVLYGVRPFKVEIPPLFHDVHGVDGNMVASDSAGRNSVQLTSGTLKRHTPDEFLKIHCTATPADIAKRNEIDDPSKVVLTEMTPPSPKEPHLCYFKWHETDHPLEHYEVYLVYRAAADAPWQFAGLHLRTEKPNRVLVTADYRRMRDSLLTSAQITPPAHH